MLWSLRSDTEVSYIVGVFPVGNEEGLTSFYIPCKLSLNYGRYGGFLT